MLELIAHGLWSDFFCMLFIKSTASYKENNPTFSSYISIDYKQKPNILKDSSLKQLEDVFCPKLSLGNIYNSKTGQQSVILFLSIKLLWLYP